MNSPVELGGNAFIGNLNGEFYLIGEGLFLGPELCLESNSGPRRDDQRIPCDRYESK